MAAREIDNFIQKFRNLWKNGLDAHLDIDTHAGQAWVGLRVRLGGSPDLHHECYQAEKAATRAKDSPSRLRRRARREAARKVKADKAVQTDAKEAELVSAEKVLVHEMNESVEAKVEEAFVLDKKENAGIEPEAENANIDYDSGENNVEIEEVDNEISEIQDDSGDNVHEDNNEIQEVKENEKEAEIETTNKKAEETISDKHPAIVVVFATAVIENSPTEVLSQSELKNLQALVYRENHLKSNIVKIEFGEYFTNRLRNSQFKHTLELKLFVATTNLWEGARSYIWRHFGQSEWSNGKGGRVAFNKIHVK